MGDFFGSLYCIAEDIFGLELANYLWGGYSPEQTSNLYVGIGVICIVVSAVIFLLYYIVIDHPKFARKAFFWFGVLGTNLTTNFIFGFWWCKKDLDAGKMIDMDGNPLSIDVVNCGAFGVANALFGAIVLIVIVCLFKGFSKNTWHIPFKLFGKYI